MPWLTLKPCLFFLIPPLTGSWASGAARRQSRGARATSPAGPRPIFPAAVGEPRGPPSAGCGPRRARGLGCSAAPGTGCSARPNLSAPASAPASGERVPPPFHFAPVRGNLRSVTRILKRATCSAGRAAPGGIAGLGRRGLGTPGSGGHAGVGARRRPAAAARCFFCNDIWDYYKSRSACDQVCFNQS